MKSYTTMIINERTFKDVYNDYFETICRFLNYYTRDYQVIEEVVQDVFVCLWEDYEGKEIQYIKTFLYNSARNRMLNYLRDEDNHTVLLEKWARIELEKTNRSIVWTVSYFINYYKQLSDLYLKSAGRYLS